MALSDRTRLNSLYSVWPIYAWLKICTACCTTLSRGQFQKWATFKKLCHFSRNFLRKRHLHGYSAIRIHHLRKKLQKTDVRTFVQVDPILDCSLHQSSNKSIYCTVALFSPYFLPPGYCWVVPAPQPLLCPCISVQQLSPPAVLCIGFPRSWVYKALKCCPRLGSHPKEND